MDNLITDNGSHENSCPIKGIIDSNDVVTYYDPNKILEGLADIGSEKPNEPLSHKAGFSDSAPLSSATAPVRSLEEHVLPENIQQNCSEEMMAAIHYLQLNEALKMTEQMTIRSNLSFAHPPEASDFTPGSSTSVRNELHEPDTRAATAAAEFVVTHNDQATPTAAQTGQTRIADDLLGSRVSVTRKQSAGETQAQTAAEARAHANNYTYATAQVSNYSYASTHHKPKDQITAPDSLNYTGAAAGFTEVHADDNDWSASGTAGLTAVLRVDQASADAAPGSESVPAAAGTGGKDIDYNHVSTFGRNDLTEQICRLQSHQYHANVAEANRDIDPHCYLSLNNYNDIMDRSRVQEMIASHHHETLANVMGAGNDHIVSNIATNKGPLTKYEAAALSESAMSAVTAHAAQMKESANAEPLSQRHSDQMTDEAAAQHELQRGIENLEHSIHVLMSMIGCGVMIHAVGQNHSRKIVWANQAVYDIYGYTREQLNHITSNSSLPQILHPDDIEIFFDYFQKQQTTLEPMHFEYRVLHGVSKHYVWCEMKSAYMGRYEDMALFICLVSDITHEKHLKDRMELWIRKSALLSEACQELVFEYDQATDEFERFGNYQNFSPDGERKHHEFLHNIASKDNIHPDDKAIFISLLQDSSLASANKRRTVKFRLRTNAESQFMWHACSAIGYTEESTGHIKIIGKVYSIHQYESKIASLHNETQREPMTHLLNRTAMDALSRNLLIEHSLESHALMMIDIDNFKKVNDSHGHAFGDEVIKMVAHCLNHAFRSTDLVARPGGDEFQVMLMDVTKEQAVALAELYLHLLAKQCANLSHPYKVTSSVGIAFYPDDANNYQDLFKAADTALYQVKNRGKNAVGVYQGECPNPDKLHEANMRIENSQRQINADMELDRQWFETTLAPDTATPAAPTTGAAGAGNQANAGKSVETSCRSAQS